MHTAIRTWPRVFTRLTVLAVLLVTFAGPVIPVPGGAPAAAATTAYAAKVDAAVWKALAESPDGTTEALVYMEAQADLSFAESMEDWNARGWAVYNALRETAGTSQARVVETLARQQADGHVTRYRSYWIVNVLTMRGDRDGLLAVAALPEVGQVLPPMKIDQPDPSRDADASSPEVVEWGINKINADDVWATYGITGTGATVANVDTGVDYTHSALVNQYRGNLGAGVFDHNYNWWDLYGTTVPNDGDSHGTHTMGTMIGYDGGANQIGVAPGAKWIAALGCCPDNDALLSSEQWIVAPTRLDGTAPDPDKRPDVNNNSWGGPGGSLIFEKLNMAQRAAGIVPVYSAGNYGSACGTSGSPGDGPAPFNVGATSSTDAIASFSSRGPSPFKNTTSPEVSAPGASVRSSIPGNSYASFSGTSMASPHVAGSVALLISVEPKLRGQVGEIEELLRKTSDPKTSTQTCGGVAGSQIPNNTFGWGRINVKAAADMIYHAGWLSGTVTSGGQPVGSVQITFSKPAYTYTLTTRTNALGQFRVVAGAGTWNLTANGYGYQTAVANGVAVTQNNATTQNFSLTALPVYTISGTVRDAGTSAGVAAYMEIGRYEAADPIWAASDGTYALMVPQGTYSLTVAHPGYQWRVMTLNVVGNANLDINLTAQTNYTCLDSRDPGGPAYAWIEASDGTPHSLSDDQNFTASLPGTFTYFGADFTSVAVNSNGLIEFGGNATRPHMLVPFEGLPNGDVLGFADDLNPDGGTQGIVYDKVVGTKLIVQYQAVEHWASGNPETFQFVLDTADDSIVVQYHTVSWPDVMSGGLEDSTGTIGQLWDFMDSAHVIDGTAVRYTAATGNAVNWGCDHALWMTYNPTESVVTSGTDDITFLLGGGIIGQYGAKAVTMTASVPLGTEYVDASPGGVLSGNIVVWAHGDQRAKATGAVWLKVRPLSLLPNGSPVQSVATIVDGTGSWRQDFATVIVLRPGGLPENSLLLPIAAYNGQP